MDKFVLGLLVGAFATVSYYRRGQERVRFSTGGTASPRTVGRVDELSSAVRNPEASPTLNAGDGTPSRTSSLP